MSHVYRDQWRHYELNEHRHRTVPHADRQRDGNWFAHIVARDALVGMHRNRRQVAFRSFQHDFGASANPVVFIGVTTRVPHLPRYVGLDFDAPRPHLSQAVTHMYGAIGQAQIAPGLESRLRAALRIFGLVPRRILARACTLSSTGEMTSNVWLAVSCVTPELTARIYPRLLPGTVQFPNRSRSC